MRGAALFYNARSLPADAPKPYETRGSGHDTELPSCMRRAALVASPRHDTEPPSSQAVGDALTSASSQNPGPMRGQM